MPCQSDRKQSGDTQKSGNPGGPINRCCRLTHRRRVCEDGFTKMAEKPSEAS